MLDNDKNRLSFRRFIKMLNERPHAAAVRQGIRRRHRMEGRRRERRIEGDVLHTKDTGSRPFVVARHPATSPSGNIED